MAALSEMRRTKELFIKISLISDGGGHKICADVQKLAEPL